MLVCEDLSVFYNEKQIFSGLSVSVYPGSIVFIRGINGSGKTSLLKLLSSLVRLDSGKIIFNDKDISKNLSWYRNLINYIGHSKSAKLHLSAVENIEFWANIYNSTELILAAIHYFKLLDYVDVDVESLSAGIRQKIELTRLITKQSHLWFLDEPENNLDVQSRELLSNLIISKANQGGIIIIASHNDFYIKGSIEINLDDYKI